MLRERCRHVVSLAELVVGSLPNQPPLAWKGRFNTILHNSSIRFSTSPPGRSIPIDCDGPITPVPALGMTLIGARIRMMRHSCWARGRGDHQEITLRQCHHIQAELDPGCQSVLIDLFPRPARKWRRTFRTAFSKNSRLASINFVWPALSGA